MAILSRDGWAKLRSASENGDFQEAKRLIGEGAAVDFGSEGLHTPLHMSSSYGKTEVTELLIDSGANVSAGDKKGYAPLLKAAFWAGNAEAAKLLIDGGANVNAASKHGYASLRQAAWKGETKAVKALISSGANVEAGDKNGETPLHKAAWAGNAETATLLISSGAALDFPADDGRAPLAMANQNDKGGVKKLLLQNGADIQWMTRAMGKADIERSKATRRPDSIKDGLRGEE